MAIRATGGSNFAARVRKRAREVPKSANQIVKTVALAINNKVILATPVDTGRARGSWFASINSPYSGQLPEGQHGMGGQRIAGNAALINRMSGEQDIYITNNVRYMQFLNAGSSRQAPANFIAKAIAAGIRSVRGMKLLQP